MTDHASVSTAHHHSGKTSPGDSLEARLRHRGWRMTAQRKAIAGALVGCDVHLTADDVLAAARQSHADISLATVYNCLTELVRLGEVGELCTGRGPTRYDPNIQTPHDHALCELCGALQDVPKSGEATRPTTLAEVGGGFQVTSAQVIFIGRCSPCLQAQALDETASPATEQRLIRQRP